ncbi:lyase, partial [Paraburkholderia sp. Se-20369]|nr:lyase [Paraburkholderia sp. Se-20369]
MLEIARKNAVAAVRFASVVAGALLAAGSIQAQQQQQPFDAFAVPAGSAPHDVAPAPDGGAVWFTAQAKGAAGRLDPAGK